MAVDGRFQKFGQASTLFFGIVAVPFRNFQGQAGHDSLESPVAFEQQLLVGVIDVIAVHDRIGDAGIRGDQRVGKAPSVGKLQPGFSEGVLRGVAVRCSFRPS